MSNSSLFLLCGLAGILAATPSVAQMVEPIEAPAPNIRSALVYRDLKTKDKYYLMPLGISIAKSGGKPAIGVQYYRAENGQPNQFTASLTLSIALDIPAADFDAIKSAVAPAGSGASLTVLPIKYKLSHFERKPGAQTFSSQTLSEGNFVTGSSIAATFQITDSKQAIRALLSNQGASLGLGLELTPQRLLGISRSAALPGDDIANEMKSIGFLVAGPNSEHSSPALSILKSKLSLWGAAEEAAARTLLNDVLGPPELSLAGDGKPQMGWDLARTDRQQAFRGRKVLQSVSVREDRPSVSLTFGLGNLCTDFADAIVDLEEGNSGCGGLN